MDDFGKTLLEAVLPLVGTALTAMTTWLVWKVRQWVDAKVHDARFHCASQKLATLVSNAVLEAEQVTVRRFKEAGAWNDTVALTVRDDVVEVVKRHLGTRGLKELVGCLGIDPPAIDGMLRTLIESKVYANRNSA